MPNDGSAWYGALHALPKDGTPPEASPERNVVVLWKDGPLQFRGNLAISGASKDISEEIRATLCCCGESQNTPFCDNSHLSIDFTELTRWSDFRQSHERPFETRRTGATS